MHTLLLIEDNTDLGATIQEYLQLQGYHVDRCQTGVAGWEQAQTIRYDCILLDVMLPEMDGFTVLQHIRERSRVPILMLTAKGTLADKKTGFTRGADDYLVKPFDFEELERRIEALLKRTTTSDTIVRGDIQIMLDENEVTKGGQPVHLTQTEFALLAQIMDADGRTVSKADLIDALRGEEALRDHTNKLDVHIYNIRKKLDKGLILSVPGVGFKSGVGK